MKLGIMQPYLFPYIGYFQLINYCDKWIVFDNVQYIERGWMNRNRIIHPTKPEIIYFTIPLEKHSRNILIKDVKIDEGSNYKEKILSQLTASYKKRAPYFNKVYKLVDDVLSYNTEYLSELSVYSLKKTCEYLEIKFNYEIFSDMNLDIDSVNDSGEWALNISKKMKASKYVNPIGGIELFDNKKFIDANIELGFLKPIFKEYNQKKSMFFPGLSIIDIMMFNSVDKIKDMLKSFDILKGDNYE